MRIDATTIFRFTIERTPGGGWQGRWQRPESFNSNGNAFANLRGGVKSTTSMAGNAVLELVELAFDDPRPGAVPDIFRFRLIGPDAVAMAYVGTQLPPYLLVRAAADDPLGNWDSERIYRRPVPGARLPAPAAGAPDPAEVGTTAPAGTEGRPAAPPRRRVIQPTDDGRIILGPPIPFLDLTRRPAASESIAGPGEAPAAEGASGAAPTTPAAPAPTPENPAPARPAQAEPQVGEDFLEGL